MTAIQYDFLTRLNLAFYKYVRKHVNAVHISKEDHIYRELLLVYARMLLYIINAYFSIKSLDDDNFCTVEEVRAALDALNEIFNTYLVVDFEITSLDVTSNVWDDTLFWNDTNIWVD